MKDVRIDSILVTATETSENALRQAVQVAKAMGSRVKIVDSISIPPAYRRMAIPDFDELAGMARHLKHERLRKLARRLAAQSIEVETGILEGDPATEIVREVWRHGHQLVVLPSGQSAKGHLAKATCMKLLQKCPCPVWVARPCRSAKRPRILAAVATEPGNAAREDLNVEVLNLSGSLAASLRGELHILHVWHAFGESMFAHSSFCRMNRGELAKYVDEMRQQHASELNSLLQWCSARLPARCVHLVKGEVRTAIPDFCREHKIDLLVLGTAGRAGLSGLLIGNTGEAIANEVDCSLLTVKAGSTRAEAANMRGPFRDSVSATEKQDEPAYPAVPVGE